MNAKLIATAGAIVAMMIAGSPALAAPASQTNPPPESAPNAQKLHKERRDARQVRQHANLIEGRIQSIDGNKLTLQPKQRKDSAGAVITVNDSTAYYVPGVSNATLSNLKAGDRVAILIDKTASSDAARIASAVSVLPLPESAMVAGEVSNAGATGFTLTGPRNNSSAVNAANAKVIVPGKASAVLSDVQNGARVVVQGKPTGDGSIDAALIVVVPQNRDNVFVGVVAAIDGNTLTLFTRDGQQLKIDASSAVILERGDAAATMSALKAGRAVAVIGIKGADDSVTAQLIGQAGLLFSRQQKR